MPAISSAVIFAVEPSNPCKDSEGTAHVAASIIAQIYERSIVLLKGDSFLSD